MARYKKRPLDNNLLPGLFDDLTPPVQEKHQPASDSGMHGHSRLTASRATDSPRPPEGLEPLKSTVAVDKLKFISFGSGSSGNCAYLGDDRFGILIDAGVEIDKVVSSLASHSIPMTSIGGIILTHDHGDHVRYAYGFLRKYRHMRLYCTPKALNGILRRHSISRRIKDYHQPIFKEFPFHIGNFIITPFEVLHDGTDNAGFFISAGSHRFVVATDMGRVSERADYYMRQANHLMIESNYDLSMLLNGSYPEYLKARIIADNGHMDNRATAEYLAEICTADLRNIFLCHLSHDNNTPQIALDTISKALTAKGFSVGDGSGGIESRDADVQLSALPRFESTGLIILRSDRPRPTDSL